MTLNRRRTGAVTVLWLACAGTAQATVISPTTTSDDISNNGNCTLREAIQAANTDTAVDLCPAGSGADVIVLGPDAYTLSLSGASEDNNQTGDLDITAPVTIEADTPAGGATIDAQSIDRVIDVQTGAQTVIKNVTITGGQAPRGRLTGSVGQPGGCIRAQSTLRLVGVGIDNCHAGPGTTSPSLFHGAGGSGFNGGDGGGVWTDAELTVRGGAFVNDHAGDGGDGLQGASAAIDSGGAGSKGGSGGNGGSGGAISIQPGGALSVTGTSFQEDFAGAGGTGGSGGGGAASSSTGNGGNGGDGGNGGAGGSAGAIEVDGTATLSHISTLSTAAGPGGDAGGGAGGGAASVGLNGTPGTDGQNGLGGGGGAGGALSDTASLHLDHAHLSDSSSGAGGNQPQESSTAVNSPGGGGAGGAISGQNVTVSDSTITNAQAGLGGEGAPQFQDEPPPGGDGGSGGAIFGLSVTLTGTTISHDQAGGGGSGGGDNSSNVENGTGGQGGSGGGVFALDGLSMTGVTLDHDRAGAGGPGGHVGSTSSQPSNGGLGGNGGGAFAGLTATVTNSTFAADAAGAAGSGFGDGDGGVGGAGGGLDVSSTGTVSHVTIRGSAAGAGGAGGPVGGTAGQPGTGSAIFGEAKLSASVIDGNPGHQCAATTNGPGNVSFPDASCGAINANPHLHPLAANGGLTKTMLLGAGSAASNTIPAASQNCSGTDQRGVPRPQGTRCDSGAVEAADPAVTGPRSHNFGPLTAGRGATATITVHTTLDPLRLGFVLGGAHAAAFAITANTCRGHLIPRHASCRVSVRFRASGSPGSRSARLQISHNTAGPPLMLKLTAAVRAKRRR